MVGVVRHDRESSARPEPELDVGEAGGDDGAADVGRAGMEDGGDTSVWLRAGGQLCLGAGTAMEPVPPLIRAPGFRRLHLRPSPLASNYPAR
jgi:hypothetical protein